MASKPRPEETTAAPLRPPGEVMRLSRMGAAHQTRLSFLRALLRRIARERWRFDRPVFALSGDGFGAAVYRAGMPSGVVSLVCFSTPLAPERRTDRVIAEAWDTSFALVAGEPDAAEIERLRANVPRQEAGRYGPGDLVLARANRSVRLFDAVVDALASGRQPDRATIEAVGYLLRTTAVYGNGKFGIADRELVVRHPELAGPFRAEMLTVWMIRAFTLDLVEHIAAARGGSQAVRLEPGLRRRLGIGNATGLGMAPFLIKHPALVGRWVHRREQALASARGVASAEPSQRRRLQSALRRARNGIALWTTDDHVQRPRIKALSDDMTRLAGALAAGGALSDALAASGRPFEAIFRWAERELSVEGQELTASLLIEAAGDPVADEFAEDMALDEASEQPVDGRMSCRLLLALIDRHYGWLDSVDFARADANARFWYVSEEKLEPRLGDRAREPGAELELPLAIARDVARLRAAAAAFDQKAPVATFLLAAPEHRHVVRRVQMVSRHPYGEIVDNLIAADMRPIDLMRLKLSFFGATRFDPRSDKWVRITLFQGAPFAEELMADPDGYDELWIYGPDAAP